MYKVTVLYGMLHHPYKLPEGITGSHSVYNCFKIPSLKSPFLPYICAICFYTKHRDNQRFQVSGVRASDPGKYGWNQHPRV